MEHLERDIHYTPPILEFLDAAVQRDIPDAVLLSGGIDSSAIAYLARRHNPSLASITVVTQDSDSPDKEFALLVASALRIERQLIAELRHEELRELVPKVAIALGSFSVYWVSAALVLFKGLECATTHGLTRVASGEGADDIFGSFPVMTNWRDGDDKLEEFIQVRLKDVDVMTQRMADSLAVRVSTPFRDEALVHLALSVPQGLKTRRHADGTTTTKYALRESFRGLLPQDVTERPQTMAFTGASTLDTLIAAYESYAEIEAYRRKYGIAFSSGLECFLFDVIRKQGSYAPSTGGNSCLYCRSRLRAEDSVHCTVCGTLQSEGRILSF